MGVTSASLGSGRATDVRLTIPAWGASWADVTLDSAVALTGAQTLTLADLVVRVTVLSGGPAGDAGRSYYRVVAGAGGWAKALKKKGYANDAGVKLATVLQDAANEVGETFDLTSIPASQAALGPAFVRRADAASRLLEQLSPGAWYVGEDGKTRVGARPAKALTATVARVSELDLARGTLTIAATSIAAVLPGAQIAGLTAVDVEHTWDHENGLRSKIWGQQGGTSRRLTALRALFDQLDPARRFRGLTEYRVLSQQGNRLTLEPVRVSTGMPYLQRVPVRPGVPGCAAASGTGYPAGMRVLVGFVDADPSRPVVLHFEDPDGGGYVPNLLSLAGGGPAIGRVGDQVKITFDATAAGAITAPAGTLAAPCTLTAGPFQVTGTITSGSSKVNSG